MRLAGKSAIITGGASGIGEATVTLFAQEGADVTIADISEDGEGLAERLRADGNKATFIQTDVSDWNALEALFQAHVDRCGGLDILFNNASRVGPIKPIAEISEEELDLVLATNFKSVFMGCKLASAIMIAAGRGAIINTTAGNAREGLAWPHLAPYVASKGAVISFTRGLAVELAPHGIRVNSLNPGLVDTPMARRAASQQPDPETFIANMSSLQLLKRLADPMEIARGALFLGSDEGSYVTGIDLLVDGGLVLG
jgi:3-oxoacyl-[acyl-carrier protein] reductase